MKRKIAFFAEILIKDYDGASRTMFNIIERIPRDDFDFFFFCGVPPAEAFDHPVMTVPTFKIPCNSTYEVAMPFLHMHKIYKQLDEYRPDIIHVASPSPLGNVALWYAKKHNIPTIGIYHTHFISYVDYYLKSVPLVLSPIKKQVVIGQRKFYDKFDRIYVPTLQMIKDLGGYGFDTERMVLWQRGLDHSVFHPGRRDVAYMSALTGNTKPNVIFASRLVWEKNLQTLVEVYNALRKEGSPYNLIIAGDGVARVELEKQMPEAVFTGSVPQEELATLYASSEVFVFPSISETYGNVVVEAMACGCPAVIAAGGGSQSHVTDGVNGYLCSPIDADSYVRALRAVIEVEEKKDSLVAGAIAYTRDLDWDVLCARYFTEVASMIDQHGQVKRSA